MANWLVELMPGWAARRAEARLKMARYQLLEQGVRRAFEAAAVGRRNQGWKATSKDANAELAPALARMRNRARDQRRNNPYAESGISAIADYSVGHGIVPRPLGRTDRVNEHLAELWKAWAETTACDADGLNNFYGLQHLCATTIPEAGEVLIRRRWRKASDGLPLGMQLQVLEPDYLDESKSGDLANGGRIIQGVEFDAIGRRVAYWLFSEHPGAMGYRHGLESKRVPADDVLHVFMILRPGQARGYTWLAPVLQRMKNLDEMDDAVIEQAKIAACFAAFVSSDPTGEVQAAKPPPLIDHVEPGIIEKLGPNESVTFGTPPTFSGYSAYSWQALHAVGVGLGVPYEILNGDLKGVNFSSGRMGWLRFYQRVHVWQWRMLIPLLCAGVWRWFLEAQLLQPDAVFEDVPAEWVPPRKVVLDPKAEGDATKESIRNGQMSWSDSVREQGYRNPRALAMAIAADNTLFDELGIVLDCDPRKVGAAGAGTVSGSSEPDDQEKSKETSETEATSDA
ncbi:phage portal protein [Pseudomonas schmalbachii]|uniref:Phage portal protein n=1 Tax=Pseudomonas schmalbachii TaxID=2816993 RepID=A0ABS3TKE5_9PSED|nr:phage portal protein [Pseudomonas schmalbachii]MBO3274136.1 phage portal protein [Pseudomonas schmalbachii]